MGRIAEVELEPAGDDFVAGRFASRDASTGRGHAADVVGEHLRRMIFTGQLRTGDRVPQDEIAARLGVSRLPVREALTGLARDGLVVVRPHQGAFVSTFDAATIRDHFEIVGLVQGLAAARLAEDAPADVLAELGELRDRVRDATDDVEVHEATMQFHRVINRRGGSERQRSVLRALGRMLPSGFFVDVPGAVASERSGVERIHAALAAGSARDVRVACLDVQRERGELVVAHLRARGVLAAG